MVQSEIWVVIKEVGKGGWGGGGVSKYKKRFSKRERGPEEGGGDVSKISQRGKTPKRLRRGGGGVGGGNIKNEINKERGGRKRGGAIFDLKKKLLKERGDWKKGK